MNITDAISITELSRLLQKSRPTIYKYITDYEEGNESSIPPAVLRLFHLIDHEDLSHDDIIQYCKTRFGSPDAEILPQARRLIEFIKENQHRIDFERLEKLLRKVID